MRHLLLAFDAAQHRLYIGTQRAAKRTAGKDRLPSAIHSEAIALAANPQRRFEREIAHQRQSGPERLETHRDLTAAPSTDETDRILSPHHSRAHGPRRSLPYRGKSTLRQPLPDCFRRARGTELRLLYRIWLGAAIRRRRGNRLSRPERARNGLAQCPVIVLTPGSPTDALHNSLSPETKDRA